jgi:hypothetical protein
VNASSTISGRLSTVALPLLALASGCLHVGRPPPRANPAVCAAPVTSRTTWTQAEAIVGDAIRRACVGVGVMGDAPPARLTIVAAGWDDTTRTGTVPTREVVLRVAVSRDAEDDVIVEARRRLASGTRAGPADAFLEASLVQLATEVAVRAVHVR